MVLLLTSFGVHALSQQKLYSDLYANHLILSYSLQMILAIATYTLLMVLHKKHKDKLGFIYITGSILKFIIAYVVLRPVFNADGQISKSEFLSLFIPYLLALAFNTWAMQGLLKENN
ncbi:MAG: DUF6168 family protein [Flavobacteriales bacterium]